MASKLERLSVEETSCMKSDGTLGMGGVKVHRGESSNLPENGKGRGVAWVVSDGAIE